MSTCLWEEGGERSRGVGWGGAFGGAFQTGSQGKNILHGKYIVDPQHQIASRAFQGMNCCFSLVWGGGGGEAGGVKTSRNFTWPERRDTVSPSGVD